MSKIKLLDLVTNVENWEIFSEKLEALKNEKEKELTFNLFIKYFFLNQPSIKEDYRNIWEYNEIPREIKKKFNLESIKKEFNFLLEERKGRFILLKTFYGKDKDTNLLENSFDKLSNLKINIDKKILITNLDYEEKEGLYTKTTLNKAVKRLFTSIKNQLKNDPETKGKNIYDYLALYKFTGKALKLVWDTNKYLMIAICLLTIFIGILPAFIAYMSKIIVDGVLLANKNPEIINSAIFYVFLEGAIVISLEAGRKALMVSQSLLRALLGQKVNVLILEKALKLDLTHFENSEFYDKMTRARREASVRPLSLVNKTFAFIQSILSLVAYGALLIKFSYLAVLALIISSIPAFIAESKFANQAFKLFTWRAPETREQIYIETLIAREDYAKEVKLYQLGDLFLNKYKDIFNRLYLEDKELTIEKGIWSYLLGSLSTISFYFIYAWIIYETVKGKISLGEMTMYLMVFRQGQSALSSALNSISGMYEDNLYLSSLYEFLDQNIEKPDVENKIEVSHELLNNNNNLNEGIVFENVTFSYPNASKPAIENISFTIKKGEKLAIVGGNGSGKTTLIKLLTKLYTPEKGRILLDGKDLKDWDMNELHKRVGVIFQDFIHYQFSVSENIGVGDIDNIEDSNTIHKASEKGMALPFISNMPAGFKTQLGTWFRGGQELSLGQWQKIALSRAFMRKKADILVLDEPTSAMDAESEIEIFEQIRNLTENQMAILISHRFSTVRNADKIIVIEKGTILESGSHQELMELGGKYSKLFTLQANSFLN